MEGVFCGANFSKNVSTPQVRVDMRQNGNDSTVLWDSPQRIAALYFYRLFTAKIFVEFSLKFIYPTISKANYSVKRIALRSTKYSMSFRGPKIWNEFLTNEEK